MSFLGGIAFDEIHHCYMSSDAFVFASSCENLPNILIEAMASGMPIICSSLGPMPEVLGEQGLYFDPFEPETLKSGIKKSILIATFVISYLRKRSKNQKLFMGNLLK